MLGVQRWIVGLVNLDHSVGVNIVRVDIDNHDGLRGLITALRARMFGDVKFYYTDHGFHYEVELYESTSYLGALRIRRMLGDDDVRLTIDEERLYYGEDMRRNDTLFRIRFKNNGGIIRQRISPLACGPYPVQEIDDAYLDCPEAGRQ